MVLTMLFDSVELLCVVFLVLIHDLVFALKLICEQHNFSCHERFKQTLHFVIIFLSGKNGKSL